LHAPTRGFVHSAQVSERERRKTSTFHGFVGNCLKASLRGPSRRDHIMVLWIFKITKLKNLKGKMEDKLNTSELVFHTRLLLLVA
jgi:hypothetical protein